MNLHHADSPVAVGLIGYGNMGGALARGIRQTPALSRFALSVFTEPAKLLAELQASHIATHENAASLAAKSRYIILAVKPYQVEDVLRTILPSLTPDKCLISLAAGVTIDQIKAVCTSCPIVRIMPNTLVTANAGLFGICFDDPAITPTHQTEIRELFSSLGQTVELQEKNMNAFTALAGCGPAYIFYVAEALIESGVTLGIDRPSATNIVMSLLKGSALLAEQTGTHPSLLREQVSSPGGMTIAGTNMLDAKATRASFVAAVTAAFERGIAMEQEKNK